MNQQLTTLGSLFFWNIEHFQIDPLLVWKDGARAVSFSSRQFEDAVLRLAKWMGRSGLQAGDRVALFCENRPEWHVVDFACHLAGVILVPVYPTLAAHQVEQILAHAGARLAFCGVPQLERVQSVRAGLPELEHLISIDAAGGIENLPAVLAGTEAVTVDERAELRARAHEEDPESVATIVYTSGTTGAPKGVMLTHRNILSNLQGGIDRLPKYEIVMALSVLPLSHVFERMLCYGYFQRGGPIAYGDPNDLRALLAEYHPTVLGAVPRILEKMREAIEATIAKMPPHRRAISKFLMGAGYAHLDKKPGFPASLYPVADLLMFRKVRSQMGNVTAFISGGAWLNPELERYFRAMGFGVIQGYGLTETAPVISCNQFGAEKIGTVGPPLGNVEVKIDEDGEILTRGPNVMKGYFKDPEATAKVFRDGWFVTGDLGRIDEDGCLVITGRRKEMLVLSNGKNVYYAPIEQALRQSRYVDQAFVIGEGRNYTAAILVANRAAVLQYAAGRGILASVPKEMDQAAFDELLMNPQVAELFRGAIDSQQADFSRFEQTKRFCFLQEEALADVELVTPTLKIRRNVLERKYGQYIEQIYRQPAPFVVPAAGHGAGPQ